MREYIRFSRNRLLHRLVGELLDVVGTALTPIFCIVLLFTYVLRIATVQGASMEPTLQNEDKLLVNLLDNRPSCGDILIINARRCALLDANGNVYTMEGIDKSIVKRVIAVGGQTVDIDFDKGVVYRNGAPLEEPYVNTLTQVPVPEKGAFTYPITIPDGYLFVMGDNREVSLDSRYPDVGLIHLAEVDGTVFARIYPPSKFGGVD